ncbi:hypothetical protein O7627_09330 [Solwaraspora sp. WMMD1047]|uniref:hypothetical protein n=1 Tax=Solwaraspora sp. WMMD1047 TaxID=3016102 RepID=UPI002416C436|nr:hypothetical protein [Solwaraspora sp. WMMD1047]MDG4829503.1 hypothetical protein [Solwaraspora sp. WMMD1047]
MFQVPNSSAIDAAATGGGPGTVVLPSIVTGQPQSIVTYATNLAQQVAKLAALFQDVDRARQELRKVWSAGSASDNAVEKLVKSAEAFKKISDAVEKVITELTSSAELIKIVQAAYQAVVRMVNPVVAALLSNPYTQGAARALASSTTAALKGFVTSVRTALDTIGLVKLVAAIAALVTVAREIHGLLSGTPAATAAPAAPPPGTTTPAVTTPGVTAPAVTAPAVTAPAVTAPGVAAPGVAAPGVAAPGVTAPAVPAPGGTAPTGTAPTGTAPGRGPGANVWIAVDPRTGLRVCGNSANP